MPKTKRASLRVVAVAGAALVAPIVVFLALGAMRAEGLQAAPSPTALFYLCSTSAQVGATVLAIFFAGLTLILARPDLRGPERALPNVIRAPQSVFTALTLTAGTMLGLAGVWTLAEPSADTQVWSISVFLDLFSGTLVLSGLLGAGWWLLAARATLSSESIMESFVDAIPRGWAIQGSSDAKRLWQSRFAEAQGNHRPPSVFPGDNAALALPIDDDVAVAIDALSGWIVASGGRPIASTLDRLLENLFDKLRGANSALAEYVLPGHLEQLLHAAIGTDDPRVIHVVVDRIAKLHMAWEEEGCSTVRSNHYNWLMPLLGSWLLKRELDRQAQQVFGVVFEAAARRIRHDDAMGIALHHFVHLLHRFIDASQACAAMHVWNFIDSYFRNAGPRVRGFCLEEVLRIVDHAGACDLPAFPTLHGEIPSGSLRDWMVIGLGHAVEASVTRARGVGDSAQAAPEWAFAQRLANGVRALFREGQKPMWNGETCDNVFLQLNLAFDPTGGAPVPDAPPDGPS